LIYIRSLLFNIIFYLNLVVFLLAGLPMFLAPRRAAIRALQLWGSTSVWWLKVICGTHMEVRGREYLPRGAALIAGKHQSFWETFAILPLLDDPCMVLKKELTYIPFFGWFIFKFRHIAVERTAGPSAIRNMVKKLQRGGKLSSCRRARARGRMIHRITSLGRRRSIQRSMCRVCRLA
jgi:1-acyl-sn-glycerol-3-phosphate acyltransferase